MATAARSLGRGLGTLLPSAPIVANGGGALYVSVDNIGLPAHQPRRHFDDRRLIDLARSIGEQGILQPLVVSPLDGGRHFLLVAGERRYRAARLLGLTEVPVVVRQTGGAEAFELALIENIQREDLNPIEEAAALQRLSTEFDLTHQQVADAVGRSRTAVSNLLRLLELDENVKTMVESRELEMGHARALLALAAAKAAVALAQKKSRAAVPS